VNGSITEERIVMKHLIQRFIREEAGQDVIEYALLAAFISIVAIAMIVLVGSDVNNYFNNVQSALVS
jgi:pilus assembly protein Flp/PilA